MDLKRSIIVDIDGSGAVTGARSVTGALNNIEGTAKRVGSSSTSAFDGLKNTLLGLAGAAGLGAVANGFLQTASTTENMSVSLKTLTGSTQAANQALGWIQQFTAKTPYDLEQVTQGFIKLTSYGLDSTRFLGTLGDVAGGMGKSLNSAVEMFADAVNGQFERLKEFGVTTAVEGDKVTFKWLENGTQMVKTTQKNQADIAAALEGVFAKFKGGMEEQSQTFTGIMSNMGDIWSLWKQNVMDRGPFDVIKGSFKGILDSFTSNVGQMRMDEWAADAAQSVLTAMQVGAGAVQGFALILKGLGGIFDGIKLAVVSVEETLLDMYIGIYDLLPASVSASSEAIAAFRKTINETKAEASKDFYSMGADVDAVNETFGKLQSMIEGARGKSKTLFETMTGGAGKATAATKTTGAATDELSRKQEEALKKIQRQHTTAADTAVSAWQRIERAGMDVYENEKDRVEDITDKWKDEYKDRQDSQKDFSEEYQKTILGETQYEIAQIKKRGEEWIKNGSDRVQVEKVVAAQVAKVQVESAAEQTKTIEKMMEGIQDLTADAFYDIFRGVGDGWSGLWSSMKEWALKTLSEIAAQAILKPIIVPIVSALTGGASTAFAGGSGLFGSGSGSGSGGLDLGSLLTNIPGGSILDAIPGAGSLTGFLGTNLPGTGVALSGLPTVGGLSIGGALGLGGLGGLGYSMLGGLVGLPQNKYSGITSSLGGALGAWGGSALAGSAAGAMFGASAGSILPGIGTVVGAIIGGLASKLFGGEKPSSPKVGFGNQTYAWGDLSGSLVSYTGHGGKDAQAEAFTESLSSIITATQTPIENLVKTLAPGKMDALKGSNINLGRKSDGATWGWEFKLDKGEDYIKEQLEKATKEIQSKVYAAADEILAPVAVEMSKALWDQVRDAVVAERRGAIFGGAQGAVAGIFSDVINGAVETFKAGGVVDYAGLGTTIEGKIVDALQGSLVTSGINQFTSIMQQKFITPFLDQLVGGMVDGSFDLQSVEAAYKKLSQIDLADVSAGLGEIFTKIQTGQEIDWQAFSDKYGEDFSGLMTEITKQGESQEEIAARTAVAQEAVLAQVSALTATAEAMRTALSAIAASSSESARLARETYIAQTS